MPMKPHKRGYGLALMMYMLGFEPLIFCSRLDSNKHRLDNEVEFPLLSCTTSLKQVFSKSD